MSELLIFEKSSPGRKGYNLPEAGVPAKKLEEILSGSMIREDEPELPEVSELDVVRHFTHLSNKNIGVETSFYPLGSCTMKYNPKVNEEVAGLFNFTELHPYFPEKLTQGALQLMYELDEYLCEISGMDKFTLQPAAGAHGELTGLLLMRAYHMQQGETQRKKVLIPDSAHGTNPASAAMCGYETIEVKSNERGGIDLDELYKHADEETVGLMITNPNTLGLFDENTTRVTEIVHNCGGLVYCDGANMNAIMGIVRPGDMGFDIVHFNLHKTFSTPHGGGGPGSGPVGVKDFLIPYLPRPLVEYSKDNENYYLEYEGEKSIGRVKPFYGNFGVMIKAYAYIRMLGSEGLRKSSEYAVLNANYLKEKLKDAYFLPFDRICMHEFVLSAKNLKNTGVQTIDVAKRLLDYGFHPPTIYFPLIVKEALMIEPTETESKEMLDSFINAMLQIVDEAHENPGLVTGAPVNTPVKRLDELTAARKPILSYKIVNK